MKPKWNFNYSTLAEASLLINWFLNELRLRWLAISWITATTLPPGFVEITQRKKNKQIANFVRISDFSPITKTKYFKARRLHQPGRSFNAEFRSEFVLLLAAQALKLINQSRKRKKNFQNSRFSRAASFVFETDMLWWLCWGVHHICTKAEPLNDAIWERQESETKTPTLRARYR